MRGGERMNLKNKRQGKYTNSKNKKQPKINPNNSRHIMLRNRLGIWQNSTDSTIQTQSPRNNTIHDTTPLSKDLIELKELKAELKAKLRQNNQLTPAPELDPRQVQRHWQKQKKQEIKLHEELKKVRKKIKELQ